MIKRFACAGVGFAMMAMPLVASAQTTTNNASLIATLTALVQQLEQELQQLLAARSSAPQQAGQVSLCASYADLKRGDTDAKTGGRVSQLQAALGISPTTGYYGALTGIGYTNKCVGGNAQPASVAGMSKYTDTAFGFSFWYPSGWTVSVNGDVRDVGTYPGGEILNTLTISGNGNSISIDEVKAVSVSSPSITDSADPSCNNQGCLTRKYFFSSSDGAWMVYYPQGMANINPGATIAADVSNNTMGGLHMLYGSARHGYDTIIPLSAQDFLVVTFRGGQGDDQRLLAKTIVATDPTVAIPVPTAQQTATIQTEASAYGANGGSSATPTATIDQNSLQLNIPLTLTGTAQGVSQVTITTYNYTPARAVVWEYSESGAVPIIGGKWSYTLRAPDNLSHGDKVVVTGENGAQLASGNFN